MKSFSLTSRASPIGTSWISLALLNVSYCTEYNKYSTIVIDEPDHICSDLDNDRLVWNLQSFGFEGRVGNKEENLFWLWLGELDVFTDENLRVLVK